MIRASPKPHPLAQRRRISPMTLCIGVICDHQEKPKIVLGSDCQQETSFAGGEVSDKLRWLDNAHNWAALIADQGGRGTHMTDTFRAHFRNRLQGDKLISEDEIPVFLEEGLSRYKIRISDEFFRMNFGVTYNEVLSNGLPGSKKAFPDKFVEEKLERLESLIFAAQLIIAGFTEVKPTLLDINEDPYRPKPVPVRRDSNFVA